MVAKIEDILPSYIFNQNDPNINQELRRRIALQMLATKRAAPKSFGEGLSAIGDAIGDRSIAREMGQADLADQAGGRAATERIMGTTPAAPAAAARSLALAPTTDVTEVPPAAVQDPPPLVTAAEQPAAMLHPDARMAGVNTAQQPSSMLNPTPMKATPPQQLPPQGGTGPVVSEGDYSPMDAATDKWEAQSRALAGIETGGRRDPYAAIGARTRSGDRAQGKYQVMAANVPSWTKGATGVAATPEQFRNDPQLQEITARDRFTGYADKYGDEGAAKAWFAGEAGMKNPAATDVHGRLNVASYGQDFMNRLNADPRAAAAAALMQQGSPPVNPTPPGGNPPVMAAGGDEPTGSPVRVAMNGQPSPNVIPGLTTAPPANPIRQVPQRVAQAQPAVPPAGYITPLGPEPQVPEKTGMSPIEARAYEELRRSPHNEYVTGPAKQIIASEAAKRQFLDARNLEVYKDKLTQRHEMIKLQETQKQGAAKAITDEQKNVAEAQKKVVEARIVARTGMEPKEFYERMDKDKASFDQTMKAQNAQQLARKAINDGVITGYGANMRIAGAKFADWAFKNGLKGDLAANTEIMNAALKTGLSEAVKTVNGEGGTGVSNNDVRIAEGIAGSEPGLQMKTIKAIMDRAAAINHRKINSYEEQVDKYLSGEPSELRYRSSHGPTAPGPHIQMLMDAQRDPTKAAKTAAQFDEVYGPGASELELARVERLARKRARGG